MSLRNPSVARLAPGTRYLEFYSPQDPISSVFSGPEEPDPVAAL